MLKYSALKALENCVEMLASQSTTDSTLFVPGAKLNIGELCNGSTTDSDSVCWGSNPYSPARTKHRKSGAFFRSGRGIGPLHKLRAGVCLRGKRRQTVHTADGGILPCEEMLLALRKSGTPAVKLTPSGKLCLLGCATQNRRSKSSLVSGKRQKSS